jgi:hypothetical protein
MNTRPRFSDEFRIIPTPMKVIAALMPAAVFTLTVLFAFLAAGPAPQSVGPRIGIAAMVFLVASVLFGVWILLVGYVYADAGRRGMGRVPWLLIVIFVPNALGFILYFILRYPIPSQCPDCGHPLEGEVAYCPKCGRKTGDACPNCKHPVGPGDAFCSACGRGLKETPEGGSVPA